MRKEESKLLVYPDECVNNNTEVRGVQTEANEHKVRRKERRIDKTKLKK